MGCRISRRQAHPPARTAAESVDIDVRFIAEAVRAAVSRVIRQGVGATDRVALVPDLLLVPGLLTGSRSPRWAARADRSGVGAAMTQLSAGSPFETVLAGGQRESRRSALSKIRPTTMAASSTTPTCAVPSTKDTIRSDRLEPGRVVARASWFAAACGGPSLRGR